MQLPFLKKSPNTSTREYFFALEIDHGLIKSAVWSVINDKPQVLAVSSNQSWDDKSEDSLITAADAALSDATSHLDPTGKVNIHKVIFGLPADWVGADKISSTQLHHLKALSEKLDLQPMGFVVTPEAATKYLQFTEGVPPTTILIGFWPHILEITLVRLGKIDGTQLVHKSAHLADDVVEGLSRFSDIDMLPSRMLLYDSGIDLEEIKQLLLAHPWQAPTKHLPFLHFPKVEILPSDFTIRAIALSGGSEVAQATGLINSASETAVEQETVSEPAHSAADLGFVKDVDIITQSPPPPPPAPSPPPPPPPPPTPKPKLRLPKAEVILFVTPKNLEHQFELVAGGKDLPAESMEAAVSADKSISTTGSKLVGDKATGAVSIANNAKTARSFPAGTILTSPSGLKFVLDETVAVASGSGDVFNPQPAKAVAKITASQIGGDYNLSAGTVFRVGTYAETETAAKNDAAISGGTSRQAKVVSKDDAAKLRADLSESLKSIAKDELSQKVSSEDQLITESISLLSLSESFDHKVDEEADNVTLKLSATARGLVVSKSELQSIIDAQVNPQIPAGYVFDTDVTQSMAVKKADKTTATFQVHVAAQLLPQMDVSQIAKDLTGKYPDRAKEYLQSLPAVGQIDILISPKMPAFLATLPRISKNITVSVRPLK
ncbi:MAG: hypothetical protein UX80_C0008G0027 [Candidatus Amesbacteria bacterium GW2011_GWA2_47_11b]|uniref:Baseplate protein J-like domain-containing protein n=1 Tax=Candidatus Amesbacteria bacterium GW2011_GWA2_47_11b TaxID=1618358 RepID=A0A0G1RKR6_9BACT|nr:MAG: hypothetical protein UX80_C0008G0027 [Candidatus Amesbacteria bacterium GW2011_GWA2_47_11b]